MGLAPVLQEYSEFAATLNKFVRCRFVLLFLQCCDAWLTLPYPLRPGWVSVSHSKCKFQGWWQHFCRNWGLGWPCNRTCCQWCWWRHVTATWLDVALHTRKSSISWGPVVGNNFSADRYFPKAPHPRSYFMLFRHRFVCFSVVANNNRSAVFS